MRNEEFIKLVQENPELKIIPFVDSEICCDDSYHRWVGSIGSCYVTEYTMFERYDDEIICIEKHDVDEIEDYLYDRDMSDEEVAEYMKNIEWKKAIFVNIDLPD